MEQVYVVCEQVQLFTMHAVKVFKNESDAEAFCDEQNDKNKPEFDSYGYLSGIFHDFYPFKVE